MDLPNLKDGRQQFLLQKYEYENQITTQDISPNDGVKFSYLLNT